MQTWIVFVALTALCWGAYVPSIHEAQLALGRNSALRAFLWVGLAYFVTAVLVPVALLWRGDEPWSFTGRGISWGFGAGALGALGALGVIFALRSGGKPIYVAPLVFACAPIVNVLVSTLLHRPANAPSPLFYLGILLSAAGAAMVLGFKPT